MGSPEVIYQFHSAAWNYFCMWLLGCHLLCNCHPADGQLGFHEGHPREQVQGLGPNGIRNGDCQFIYERARHAHYHDRYLNRLAMVDLWYFQEHHGLWHFMSLASFAAEGWHHRLHYPIIMIRVHSCLDSARFQKLDFARFQSIRPANDEG